MKDKESQEQAMGHMCFHSAARLTRLQKAVTMEREREGYPERGRGESGGPHTTVKRTERERERKLE